MKYLCGVLEFRFISGFSNLGFNILYNSFDPSILHYIPATSVNTALGMVTGASIGGVKSVLLLGEDQFDAIKYKIIDINSYNNIPIMVIVLCSNTYKPGNRLFKYFKVKEDFISILKKANSYIDKEQKPCVLLLDEEALV